MRTSSFIALSPITAGASNDIPSPERECCIKNKMDELGIIRPEWCPDPPPEKFQDFILCRILPSSYSSLFKCNLKTYFDYNMNNHFKQNIVSELIFVTFDPLHRHSDIQIK